MNIYSNWDIGDTAYAVQRDGDVVTIAKVTITGFIITKNGTEMHVCTERGDHTATVPSEALHEYWYSASCAAMNAMDVKEQFTRLPTAEELAKLAELAEFAELGLVANAPAPEAAQPSSTENVEF